jgi:hypothetical protein
MVGLPSPKAEIVETLGPSATGGMRAKAFGVRGLGYQGKR